MLDVPAEKERINSEIEKLNRERVEIAVKIQADVKVLYCVSKVFEVLPLKARDTFFSDFPFYVYLVISSWSDDSCCKVFNLFSLEMS